MNTEEYINKLFTDAGWFAGRSAEISGEDDTECDAMAHAVTILREYGGLTVGQVGAGREQAASDIMFYGEPCLSDAMVCRDWESKLGKLVAIACAHDDYILILVNPQGKLFIFTEPDEKLYLGGSFEETTSKLLLGLKYGSPIDRA